VKREILHRIFIFVQTKTKAMLKITSTVFFLILLIWANNTQAQNGDYYVPSDSLHIRGSYTVKDSVLITKPKLDVPFNPSMLVLSVLLGATTYGFTGHQFQVNNNTYYNHNVFKPYLLNPNNQNAAEIIDNYNSFKQNRTFAIFSGVLGTSLYIYGFNKLISSLLIFNQPQKTNMNAVSVLFTAGTVFIISAPIIKLRGIGKLKKAVNLYNLQP
jgi:hypothetical protein